MQAKIDGGYMVTIFRGELKARKIFSLQVVHLPIFWWKQIALGETVYRFSCSSQQPGQLVRVPEGENCKIE